MSSWLPHRIRSPPKSSTNNDKQISYQCDTVSKRPKERELRKPLGKGVLTSAASRVRIPPVSCKYCLTNNKACCLIEYMERRPHPVSGPVEVDETLITPDGANLLIPAIAHRNLADSSFIVIHRQPKGNGGGPRSSRCMAKGLGGKRLRYEDLIK